MDPSTELANLEAENARRLDALNKQGVDLEPGTFELMQVTVYLEHVLRWIGHDHLFDAKWEFAERAGVAIGKLEVEAHKKITRLGNRTNTRP